MTGADLLAYRLADALDEGALVTRPAAMRLEVHRPAIEAALAHEPAAGRRTPATVAINARRDALLHEASAFYPPGSDRERAAVMKKDWDAYASTAWQRDREAPACPSRHIGTKQAAYYKLMRLSIEPRSAELIRRVLGKEPPLFPTHGARDADGESEDATCWIASNP